MAKTLCEKRVCKEPHDLDHSIGESITKTRWLGMLAEFNVAGLGAKLMHGSTT